MSTLTPKHAHLFPAIFLQFHLEETWGMDVQTRLDVNTNIDK